MSSGKHLRCSKRLKSCSTEYMCHLGRRDRQNPHLAKTQIIRGGVKTSLAAFVCTETRGRSDQQVDFRPG